MVKIIINKLVLVLVSILPKMVKIISIVRFSIFKISPKGCLSKTIKHTEDIRCRGTRNFVYLKSSHKHVSKIANYIRFSSPNSNQTAISIDSKLFPFYQFICSYLLFIRRLIHSNYSFSFHRLL